MTDIQQWLANTFPDQYKKQTVKEIYFYGSGTPNGENQRINIGDISNRVLDLSEFINLTTIWFERKNVASSLQKLMVKNKANISIQGTPRPDLLVDSLGEISNSLRKEIQELKAQVAQKEKNIDELTNKLQEKTDTEGYRLRVLFNLLFSNQTYDFDRLEQEIAYLKHKELAPQVRNERVKFEQLITDAKNKIRGSEKIIDLLLETQKQISQTTETSKKDKLCGKIEAYQSILEDSLTLEEIQNLLNRQTELQQLDEQLSSLQVNAQT